jgi:hypothetical protein
MFSISIFKWQFWLLLIIIVFFFLWLFWGGKPHEFTGLKPLRGHGNLISRLAQSRIYPPDEDPLSPINSPRHSREEEREEIREEREEIREERGEIREERGEIREVSNSIPAVSPLQPNSPRDTVPVLPVEISMATPTVQIDATPEIPEAILESVRNIPVRLNPRAGHASRMEAECCAIMEEIYGVPFTTVRPDFLVNPETNKNLEIDCYNHDLRIGVEYNGPTHYKWPNHFPQTYEQFIAQIRRDQYKIDACDAAGVYLITVPHDVPREWLRQYITYYLPENVADRLRQNRPPVQTQQETLI